MRTLLFALVAAATSCSHVPSLAQPQTFSGVPLNFITDPSECASQGGCIVIGRTAMHLAMEMEKAKAVFADRAKVSQTCRRSDA